jgi:hypothetical protein
MYIRAHNTEEPLSLSPDQLRKSLKEYGIGGAIIEAACDQLRSNARLMYFDAVNNPHFKIGASGIIEIESELENPRSGLLKTLRSFGKETRLGESLGQSISPDSSIDIEVPLGTEPSIVFENTKFEKQIIVTDTVPQPNVLPASDRVVSLDHNSAPYREAVGALDAAISVAEKSNSLGDLTAGERSSILSQLKTGRTLFDDKTIRVSAYRAVLEPGLRWLLEKCADNAVGLALTAALTAIGTLLGLAG